MLRRWTGEADDASKQCRPVSEPPGSREGNCEPITEAELQLVEDLENASADGWTELAKRPQSEGTAGLQLLYRQFPNRAEGGESTNASELRAFLTLPVPADAIFSHVYSCAFLSSCFPSWGFVTSASAAGGGNDIVRISSDRLELFHWRRLQENAKGSAWFMRPASRDVISLPAVDGGKATRAMVSPRQRSVVDILGLDNAVFGCCLRPVTAAMCQLFIYARLPGSGMLMRTALRRLCPGSLKRLARELCEHHQHHRPLREAEPAFEHLDTSITPASSSANNDLRSGPSNDATASAFLGLPPQTQTAAPLIVDEPETARAPIPQASESAATIADDLSFGDCAVYPDAVDTNALRVSALPPMGFGAPDVQSQGLFLDEPAQPSALAADFPAPSDELFQTTLPPFNKETESGCVLGSLALVEKSIDLDATATNAKAVYAEVHFVSGLPLRGYPIPRPRRPQRAVWPSRPVGSVNATSMDPPVGALAGSRDRPKTRRRTTELGPAGRGRSLAEAKRTSTTAEVATEALAGLVDWFQGAPAGSAPTTSRGAGRGRGRKQ